MLLHNDCPVVALYTQTEAFNADIVRTRQSSVSAKLTNTIHVVEWRKISDPKAHSLFLSLSLVFVYVYLFAVSPGTQDSVCIKIYPEGECWSRTATTQSLCAV